MNRSPLKRKRETARRKVNPMPLPGAAVYKRVKDTRKRGMNAVEKRHADRLAAMGCLVCRMPAQIHHERRVNGRRDHRYIAPLCAGHHLTNEDARHRIRLDDFNTTHGLDLVKWVKDQWEISQKAERVKK